MKYYSPLRYPGGKGKLSPFLADVIEQQRNNREETVFVEPFAGGAGAALTLLMTGRVSKIIINDLDPAIYAFWKTAVFDTDRLIREIKKINISINEWEKQREVYKSKSNNEFKLGFATFFLNRTNRSGIIEGGPIGGMKQQGEWIINARFRKEEMIRRLENIKKFREHIDVKNYDGIDLLKYLQSRKKISKYFVFIDPPYTEKGQLLYLNYYQEKDHRNLANFLDKAKFDWVMTYDDTQNIRQLYSNKKVRGFEIPHTAHSHRVGKEVLISPKPIKVII